MRRCRAEAGFTLLEILVATAIFALAAALAFGGLRNILHAREILAPRHQSAAALRLGVSLLTQDLVAAAPRPVRDALGAPAPALVGGVGEELVVFSRLDPTRPLLLDAVAVQRVSYRLREGRLLREIWPVVDVVQATRPREQVLLENVAEVRLRFMAVDAVAWSEVWPVISNDLAALPRAIEIDIVFSDGRSLRRLVLPAQGT